MRCTLIYPAGIIVLASACDVPPPVCAGSLQDACRKASDLAYALGVQIADETSDGNTVLGDVGTMGATGKAAVSFRINAMRTHGVRTEGVTARTDGTEGTSTFPADRNVATTMSLGGAVGAWGGMRVGSTRVGGIDLLGSLVIPITANRGDLQINSRPIAFGAGVRLGVIQETHVLPSVSLTTMLHQASRFSVETLRLPTDAGESVTLRLEDELVKTRDYRLGISKNFGELGVSGGVGRNAYSIDADYFVEGPGSIESGNERASFDLKRTHAFVGATYTRKAMTFGAEFGRLMGKDSFEPRNTFGEGSTVARNYLSLGMRIAAGRSIAR